MNSWLVRDDEVLSSLEIANDPKNRMKGLLGRDSFDAAIHIEHCRSVHTFGMKFDIDVAFLNKDLEVIRTVLVKRNRMTAVVFRATSVVEAQSGSFRDWGLAVGDKLEIR